MPNIAKKCHELGIPDATKIWRIIYGIDEDAILSLIALGATNQDISEVIKESKQVC